MASIEVKWSLRQNQWKVHSRVFDTIQNTKVILCSGYHDENRCDVDMNGDIILNPNNKKGNNYVNDVNNDDYAIVFENGNKNEALLVKIVSNVYKKVIPEITIYKREGYQNYYNGNEVEVCLTGHNTKKYTHSEIMHAYVRDIEIIRKINSNEPIFKKYWKFQSSIQKNHSEERFISN